MAAWRVLREPTVPILLAASVVHIVRRDLFDLLLFAGTAVVILLDARRSRSASAAAGRAGRARAWLVVAGMTLFSAVVALAAPASVSVRLVLVAIGLAALVLVLARPRRSPAHGRGPSRAPGWPVWALIGVAACLWELTSFIAQQVWPLDQEAHPAVSDLVGPLLQTWPGRAVFLLLWAGAGWWLLLQLIGGAVTDEIAGSGQRAARGAAGRQEGEPSEPGPRPSGSSPLPGRSDGHEAGR